MTEVRLNPLGGSRNRRRPGEDLQSVTDYIALLRAVNVGGRNRLSMSDLKEVFAELGLDHVNSLLQTGNVAFRGRSQPRRDLESTLGSAVESRLGVKVDVLVRADSEWSRAIAKNPFPSDARNDPARVVLMVLRDAPSAAARSALDRAVRGREVARVLGDHAYIVYPDGIGRSRFTPALIERTLGTRGTARNWNTVLKIGELLAG
jgi:uncharacterized protein (DUF1697 family)